MHVRGMILTLLFVANIGSSSSAVSVRLAGETSSLPFEVTFQNLRSPVELVLQVVNEGEFTVSVMSWQLELELRPLPGSQGTLLFYDAMAPPDGLFGEVSQPQTIPELPPPSDTALVFDADTTEFDGEPVPENVARNILQLMLEASPDAMGAFQLVMTSFNPAIPYEGSSWWDADQPEPEAFDNSSPSGFPGYILLGTFDVDDSANVPPGDFDRDGEVTDTDYSRWKSDFGTIVGTAGEGADGNNNSIIDAADFVIWRKNFVPGVAASRNISHTLVPEPPPLILLHWGLFTVFGRLRQGAGNDRSHKQVRSGSRYTSRQIRHNRIDVVPEFPRADAVQRIPFGFTTLAYK